MWDSIDENVLIAIRQIIRAVDLRAKSLINECGLTGPQLTVLRELHKHENIAVGVLASKLSLSNATVTGILDRLLHKKLISRERCNKDRRKMLVKISHLGNELLQNSPSLLEDQFIKKFRLLEVWERNLILSSLQRVATMMNANDLQAAPMIASGPLTASAEKTHEFLSQE